MTTSKGEGNGVAVTIDHELCSGTRHCEARMPEVFVVRQMKSYVRDDVNWAEVDTGDLRVVAEMCPWCAIDVSETE